MIPAVVQRLGCVGHERNAGTGEVEVIEPEAETANALIGIEIEPQVITSALPTQLDHRVDDVTVIRRAGIDVESNAGTDDQGPCDLLHDADAKRAQVNGLIEGEGTGP